MPAIQEPAKHPRLLHLDAICKQDGDVFRNLHYTSGGKEERRNRTFYGPKKVSINKPEIGENITPTVV